MWKKFAWLLFFMPFGVTGCLDGAGGGSTDFAVIPDVEVECSTAQATTCDQSGVPVYVGLSADIGIDCEAYIASLPANDFTVAFDASGISTSTIAGQFLQATISSWLGPLGSPVAQLERRTYKICAYVDRDNDGELDLNEAVGFGQLTTGDGITEVTDWVEYGTFLQ